MCEEKDVYTSVTTDNDGLYIKIVNVSAEEKEIELDTIGGRIDDDAAVAVLSAKPEDENSIDNPNNVVPLCREQHYETGDRIVLPGYSVIVIKI